MIKNVHIQNFKSVVDLNIELGTFNVLIGENGCGKSNILESIAFGAAASANKLDFEFFGSRGIRYSNPEFMYSAFSDQKIKKIQLNFEIENEIFDSIQYTLSNDPKNSKKWINESKEIRDKEFGNQLADLLFNHSTKERKKELNDLFEGDKNNVQSLLNLATEIKRVTSEKGHPHDNEGFFKYIFNNHFLTDRYSNDLISNYIIYSPEQSSLRKFEETTQIYPLGIRGEGLFQYLKELSLDKKSKKKINEIKKCIELLDWYENFELPKNLLTNEYSLNIKDKYIHENLEYFDQRSTNEGFLFLLFYATLFISETTPSFFAIDNIDNSFNPKLCAQIIRTLAALAKKYNKQVIVTTQNPAILDGLNLSDNKQKLFVVSRNDKGYTRAEQIKYNKDRTMKLSEVWTKGFIGGLPSNF